MLLKGPSSLALNTLFVANKVGIWHVDMDSGISATEKEQGSRVYRAH